MACLTPNPSKTIGLQPRAVSDEVTCEAHNRRLSKRNYRSRLAKPR